MTRKSIYDARFDSLEGRYRYLPPQCDVAIHRPWFWHQGDRDTLRSLQHLEAAWYRPVGLRANLLLNVLSSDTGQLDEDDWNRLIEVGTAIRNRFSQPFHATVSQISPSLSAPFPKTVTFHLFLEKAIEDGQRISRHSVSRASAPEPFVDGVFTVGSQRVHTFPTITTDRLDIDLGDSAARLCTIAGYRTGVEGIPELEDQLCCSSAQWIDTCLTSGDNITKTLLVDVAHYWGLIQS